MKTEQLISQLARDIHPVPPGALVRRLLLAASVGSMVTLACVAVLYGFRHDLAAAVLGTAFWIKAGFTVAVASIGFLLVERAGRPAAHLNARLLLVAVPFAFVIAIGWIELAHTPPSERLSAWLGQTWRSCPFSIAFLALPPLVLVLLALRKLAPTHLKIAGFAAGILSGGLAATAYGLHCPERSASFVATWYAAGILLCGVIGAIAGRRVLRW
jgi:hypothetical protein